LPASPPSRASLGSAIRDATKVASLAQSQKLIKIFAVNAYESAYLYMGKYATEDPAINGGSRNLKFPRNIQDSEIGWRVGATRIFAIITDGYIGFHFIPPDPQI
jgi:hypothetical protein